GERGVTASLDGQAVPLDGDEAKTREAIASIARVYVRGRVTLRAPVAGDVTRAPMREELGARVDPERVASLAREVRDGESALRRAHRGKHGALWLPIPVR